MIKRFALLPLLLLLAGCLQIETVVRYQEDGSALITERVNFSASLLDMASGDAGGAPLVSLLSREAAMKRLEHMGKGITLVSHELRDGLRGSRESLAVFRIPDLNDFYYVSPWFAYRDYAENNAIKWNVSPMYKSRAYAGGRAGEISIDFGHVKAPDCRSTNSNFLFRSMLPKA